MFISAQKHLFWTGVFFHQCEDPTHWWKNTPGPKKLILGRNPNYKIVKIFILLCYFKILLVPPLLSINMHMLRPPRTAVGTAALGGVMAELDLEAALWSVQLDVNQ